LRNLLVLTLLFARLLQLTFRIFHGLRRLFGFDGSFSCGVSRFLGLRRQLFVAFGQSLSCAVGFFRACRCFLERRFRAGRILPGLGYRFLGCLDGSGRLGQPRFPLSASLRAN
jgi:hypothetical protein